MTNSSETSQNFTKTSAFVQSSDDYLHWPKAHSESKLINN
jgi:hypothetical protein